MTIVAAGVVKAIKFNIAIQTNMTIKINMVI